MVEQFARFFGGSLTIITRNRNSHIRRQQPPFKAIHFSQHSIGDVDSVLTRALGHRNCYCGFQSPIDFIFRRTAIAKLNYLRRLFRPIPHGGDIL